MRLGTLWTIAREAFDHVQNDAIILRQLSWIAGEAIDHNMVISFSLSPKVQFLINCHHFRPKPLSIFKTRKQAHMLARQAL